MSRTLINNYLKDLDILKTASGTVREGVVSEAFKDLLKAYARAHNLIFLNQYELPPQDGKRRYVDGALVYDVRLAFGYWEAKDEEDDLDKEIAAKFKRGYGVLHDPLYREKYAQNLKREFPRIPFHEDFWLWADWGEKLMALHIHYELVEPWPLQRADTPDAKAARAGQSPRPILKSDPDAGIIMIDSETQLGGVPKQAFAYRLGNRSALDWILDQHKEKTPKDPTIREKFNTYRFADHKERVIDLLARVTRVSVETMEIVEAMRGEGSRQ